MKVATFSLIIPFFLISSFVYGQSKQGDWELSLSGYLGSIKHSTKVTGPSYHRDYGGEAQSYVVSALRTGYYFIEGFEFEPEITWTAQEHFPPALALSANISLNLNIPNSKVTPFLLIGYGYANGLPITQRLLGRESDQLDIGCFSAGAGLKIFVAAPVALRIEYRYQSYNQETSNYGYSYESTTTFHTLLIGFSFLL